LRWRTATEIDNAGFNIYRSARKNGSYTKVNDEIIPAKGNATAGTIYSYEDTPGRGKFYYKLEDMDSNGVSTMHETGESARKKWRGGGKEEEEIVMSDGYGVWSMEWGLPISGFQTLAPCFSVCPLWLTLKLNFRKEIRKWKRKNYQFTNRQRSLHTPMRSCLKNWVLHRRAM